MNARRLTVTSCNIKYEGTSKKTGNPFTLYEVAVRGEDGEPVDEEFKSFENLPVGELIEYEIEKEDHEKYGVSYLLKLPKGMRPAARPNLQGDIADLRQRVSKLESEVGAMTGGATNPSPAVPDEDIPF